MTEKLNEIDFKGSFKRELKNGTQLIASMLRKRRFRPQVLCKKIHSIHKKGMNFPTRSDEMSRCRQELKLAETWINNPPRDMTCDVIVFRLLRAIPRTSFSRRYLKTVLENYSKVKNKRWKMIPEVSEIALWPNKRAAEHVEKLIEHFSR